MRIFQTFPEAFSEIERDLNEMGTTTQRNSWQGKDVSQDEGFKIKEMRNYGFTVQKPDLADLNPTQPWADIEFGERISERHVNPGVAWKHRPDVWESLREEDGLFSYTYNERLRWALDWAVELLITDPTTRRCFLPIYHEDDLLDAIGHRVPCTLGYLFEPEGDKLHLTYFMRSSDYSTHFHNDLYLALRLAWFVIAEVNEKMRVPVADENGADPLKPTFGFGEFTFFTANLHVFAKDVAHAF